MAQFYIQLVKDKALGIGGIKNKDELPWYVYDKDMNSMKCMSVKELIINYYSQKILLSRIYIG